MKVVITVAHGFHARIILRSNVFHILRKQATVLILAPNADEDDFKTEFSYDNVILAPLQDQYSWLERKFEGLRKSYFSNPNLLGTLNIKNENLRFNRPFKYKFMRLVNLFVGRFKLIRECWLWLESILFPDKKHEWVFDAFMPDALLTATPGVFPSDARLIRAAKRKGIATFCIVQSWDNLTSKGFMGARPDKLIVWNEIMQKEAFEYHGYRNDDVFIGGVPHFDVYASFNKNASKNEAFKKLGLDPSKKIIFFGTTASVHYPENLEVIDILVKALKNNKFVEPVQILVRLHPQSVSGPYKEDLQPYLEYKEFVIYDLPQIQSHGLDCNLHKEDLHQLHMILSCVDVTINTASTLTIDACAHDCPVVNIGFDGYKTKAYANSAIRFYDYTHYKNIVSAGAVKIAKSPEDFIGLINRYLENHELEKQNRQQVVDEQCFKLDGRSGERVAHYIISNLTQKVTAIEKNGKANEKDIRAYSISK